MFYIYIYIYIVLVLNIKHFDLCENFYSIKLETIYYTGSHMLINNLRS